MYRIHIVVNPSFYRGEVSDQCETLTDRLRERGARAEVLFSDAFPWGFCNGAPVGGLHADLTVFLNKDHLLSSFLEKKGELLLNSAESVRICDDKCLTYLALSGKGIPLSCFVFLQNFSESDLSFLPVSWSLSVEAWFYFLIPPLFWLLYRLLSGKLG